MENVSGVLKFIHPDDELGEAYMQEEAGFGEESHSYLARAFGELGYTLHALRQNAIGSGFAQSRARVHLIAARHDVLPEVSSKDICAMLDDAYSSMPKLAPRDITQFLLSGCDLDFWREKSSAKRLRRESQQQPTGTVTGQWVQDHAEAFKAKGIRWPPPTKELQRFQLGEPLSKRELEIMYYYSIVHPILPESCEERFMVQ